MTLMTPEEIFSDKEKLKKVNIETRGGYFEAIEFISMYNGPYKEKIKEVINVLDEMESISGMNLTRTGALLTPKLETFTAFYTENTSYSDFDKEITDLGTEVGDFKNAIEKLDNWDGIESIDTLNDCLSYLLEKYFKYVERNKEIILEDFSEEMGGPSGYDSSTGGWDYNPDDYIDPDDEDVYREYVEWNAVDEEYEMADIMEGLNDYIYSEIYFTTQGENVGSLSDLMEYAIKYNVTYDTESGAINIEQFGNVYHINGLREYINSVPKEWGHLI